MYDVIVVGARVAGSATAMLLARKGLRVLVIDRVTFPSDTISTHLIQLQGVARLNRWGLLDQLLDSNAPPIRHTLIDAGGTVLEGSPPPIDGGEFVLCPRRTTLDTVLLNAARQAGAEIHERRAVGELVWEEDRVVGVKGDGFSERAHLIVGADGKQSLVAKQVNAAAYNERPSHTTTAYTYYRNFPTTGGENCGRTNRAVGIWPTNDDCVMAYVAWPLSEEKEFRKDVAGNFLTTLDLAGDVGERARDAERTERFRVTTDLPNFFRRPFGNGWALVGDAGLTMDPMSAQGISDALRDAEFLAEAIEENDFGRYQRRRDEAVKPMYEFTMEIASFSDPPRERANLFNALVGKQDEINRYLGVIAGSVPVREFFNKEHLERLGAGNCDDTPG